jgi:hypothetical protein
MTMTRRPSDPAPRPDPALQPRCSTCGSGDVVRDAWAGWDPEGQCWTLQTVFDHAQCQECGTATTLDWTQTAPGPDTMDPAG